MIKLIGFLYSGCWHKWKIIDRQKVDYKGEFSSWTADRYVLQCEHCGNVKAKVAR
jgi:hypothetical protein